jgi:dTDP-4-dehydrorhamnose reductase
LAEEAKRVDALLIHFSTDYVFDGVKDTPYVEEDRPNPINVYGRSKLAGEQAIRSIDGPHLILRTSWVYATRGRNFFLTIRRLLREKEEVRVVSDQMGAPTPAGALGSATSTLLRKLGVPNLPGTRGTYHLTTAGNTSWHGFAKEIARLESRDLPNPPRIVPIPSDQYPSVARRPRNSCLSNEKLLRTFGVELPRWEACLAALHERLPRGAHLDVGAPYRR